MINQLELFFKLFGLNLKLLKTSGHGYKRKVEASPIIEPCRYWQSCCSNVKRVQQTCRIEEEEKYLVFTYFDSILFLLSPYLLYNLPSSIYNSEHALCLLHMETKKSSEFVPWNYSMINRPGVAGAVLQNNFVLHPNHKS